MSGCSHQANDKSIFLLSWGWDWGKIPALQIHGQVPELCSTPALQVSSQELRW